MSVHKTQQEKAELDEKAKEVAYVRSEKRADDDALEKLQQHYGQHRKHENQKRRRIWNCGECGFKNMDTRDVCGVCLSPNPAIIQQQSRSMTNDLRPPRATLDPSSKVIQIGGRSYREYLPPTAGPGRVRFAAAPPPAAAAAAASCDVSGGAAAAVAAACGDDEPDCRRRFDDEEEEEDDNVDDYGGAPYQEDDEDEDEDGISFDKQRQCFVLKLSVPRRFHKFVIGSQGKTLQQLQRMTGATVKLNDTDFADVSGPNRACVTAARIKLEAIMLDNETRVSYTHFISIPLASGPDARSAVSSFMQDLVRLGVDDDKHIDPYMFQTPARLHLTLLMLRLHSDEELARATDLLRGPVQDIVRGMFSGGGGGDDKISFSKLSYMNDDPTEVHVVYLEPVRNAASKKLVELIERINELFLAAGLALPTDVAHNEKLHATVINSKWRGGTVADDSAENYSRGGGGGGQLRQSFDATEIFRIFQDCSALGSHKLERLDLSKLGSGNASDGYYAREMSVFFP